MYKHKYIFFLTILLFVFVCNIIIPAHASAQGSFFDALCGAIVDNINELVIQEEVDQETKQVQTSAVKVFLRGDESDWDEFVDSTEKWAESALKTETEKPTSSPSKTNIQKKFVKEVSRIKKDVGKAYYFEGKVGNIDFTMKVPPYKHSTYDISTKRHGTAFADRVAKIIGIYPLNNSKSLVDRIKSIFTGKNNQTKYFVILHIYDAKEKTFWPSYMSMGDCRNAFGEIDMIVDENTNYIDFFEEAKMSISGSHGFINAGIKKYVEWDIPDIFTYDLDHDGFDELIRLHESTFANEPIDFTISVCSPKYLTKEKPLGECFSLVIATIGYKMVAGLDGSFEDKFIKEINYRNIHFDGNNLYIDGKNIMEYK